MQYKKPFNQGREEVFKDIKKDIDRPEIKDLINYCIFPDPENLIKVVNEYKNCLELQMFGIESENEIVGIIGYLYVENDVIQIKHMSVRPDCRGAGFGRGLILELLSSENPKKLLVETDDEAVDFFRRIGFEINSLGEKYPGVERYLCSYVID